MCIMISERPQSRMGTYCKIPFMWHFGKGKGITDKWLPGVRGGGRVGIPKVLLKVFFRILKLFCISSMVITRTHACVNTYKTIPKKWVFLYRNILNGLEFECLFCTNWTRFSLILMLDFQPPTESLNQHHYSVITSASLECCYSILTSSIITILLLLGNLSFLNLLLKWYNSN